MVLKVGTAPTYPALQTGAWTSTATSGCKTTVIRYRQTLSKHGASGQSCTGMTLRSLASKTSVSAIPPQRHNCRAGHHPALIYSLCSCQRATGDRSLRWVLLVAKRGNRTHLWKFMRLPRCQPPARNIPCLMWPQHRPWDVSTHTPRSFHVLQNSKPDENCVLVGFRRYRQCRFSAESMSLPATFPSLGAQVDIRRP